MKAKMTFHYVTHPPLEFSFIRGYWCLNKLPSWWLEGLLDPSSTAGVGVVSDGPRRREIDQHPLLGLSGSPIVRPTTGLDKKKNRSCKKKNIGWDPPELKYNKPNTWNLKKQNCSCVSSCVYSFVACHIHWPVEPKLGRGNPSCGSYTVLWAFQHGPWASPRKHCIWPTCCLLRMMCLLAS